MGPHDKRQQRFDELYRQLEFARKARYNASRRLRTYHLFSQITPAFIALGLIVIPLVDILRLGNNYSPRYVDFMQIVFAVALLMYSLLLGIGDFSARAERMHICGLSLGRIAKLLFPFKEKLDSEELDEEYKYFINAYYDCLEKHENHTHVDYLAAKYELLGYGNEHKWEEELRRSAIWLNKFLRECFSVSHFVVSIAAISVWIYFMIE